MSTPTKVAVTGAAGQIGYAMLFRIASGRCSAPTCRSSCACWRSPRPSRRAEGTAMELDDCAFPLLAGIEITDDPRVAFDGVNVALLVGARPRGQGMERGDLLEANGGIFKPQGQALNSHAATDVSVLVVGNPANTNALIAMINAPDIPRERFTAMTRLDHNRAIAQLAAKTGVAVTEITNMTIWGNHSATPVPRHLPRQGRPAATPPRSCPTRPGSRTTSSRRFRSAAPRSSRRAASPAPPPPPTPRSTTSATGCAGTAAGDWVSMAVPPTVPTACRRGSQRLPVTTSGGDYTIVAGTRDRRLLALANRCLRRGADRRARRRARARPARLTVSTRAVRLPG